MTPSKKFSLLTWLIFGTNLISINALAREGSGISRVGSGADTGVMPNVETGGNGGFGLGTEWAMEPSVMQDDQKDGKTPDVLKAKDAKVKKPGKGRKKCAPRGRKGRTGAGSGKNVPGSTTPTGGSAGAVPNIDYEALPRPEKHGQSVTIRGEKMTYVRISFEFWEIIPEALWDPEKSRFSRFFLY